MGIPKFVKTSPATAWSTLTIMKKYWYWIVLVVFMLPTIIGSIEVAVETNNPSYPFFILATHITSSDQMLELKVMQLENGQLDEIVGMDKPETGLWKNTVWHWKWFWAVPFAIIGLIYTIFLPAIIIYKLIRPRNTSEPYKNFWKTTIYFLLYLFITNTIILIYGVTQGSILVTMPEGVDKFKAFWLIMIEMIPFHGLVKFFIYVANLSMGRAPPMI